MSADERDYSSYLAYESMAVQVLALLCGFTFTSITILLTLLPDPNQVLSQVTLFFLAFMFDLMLFMLSFAIFYVTFCVKAVPPEAKGRRTIMWLWVLVFSLWGLAIVLMFFLWNLMYLALASGVTYVLFTILDYIYIWKPFIELSKRLRSQR